MRTIINTNYWLQDKIDYDNSRVAQSYFGNKVLNEDYNMSECLSGCTTCATTSCATGCMVDD
ncbi:hypothetical protein [Faecalicoccus pleomorphus]|uniref:hypothetical protein n=1 Tax=Faecalicoccus pleomorphus TaxID=1323 RepID=UPI0039F48923